MYETELSGVWRYIDTNTFSSKLCGETFTMKNGIFNCILKGILNVVLEVFYEHYGKHRHNWWLIFCFNSATINTRGIERKKSILKIKAGTLLPLWA